MPYNEDFRSTLDTLQQNSIPSTQILDSLVDPANIDHRDVGDEVKTMRSEGRQDDSILRVITAKASPPVKSQEYPSALRGEFGKLIHLPGEMARAFGAGAMEMLNIPATGMAMVGAGLSEPYKGIAPSEAGWGREGKANLKLGENLIKTGQRQAQTIGGWQEKVAPQITSLDDVKTPADMVTYAGTQFTNLLGTMLPAMAMGGLGGGAAKKAIEKESFRISQEMIGKGFAPEVVKATVDKQTQRALDKLMFKQALKVEIPMEAEQINVEAVRRGEPPTLAEAALPAVIAGIPGAAGEAPILSRVLPSMRKIGGVPKTFLGKATATTWKTLLEATTESQQSWFERLFSGQGVVGPEADKEIRDTFYGVGLGVLPMSIFGVIPGKRARNISRLNQLIREDPEFSKQFSEVIKKNPTRYQELKEDGLELETPTAPGTERPVGIPGVPVAKTKEDAIKELAKRRPDLAKIMQEVGTEVPAEGERPAPPPTPPKEPGAPIPPIAPAKEPMVVTPWATEDPFLKKAQEVSQKKITLYRGESATGAITVHSEPEELRGQWWTTSKRDALDYAKGEGARVISVDVPTEELPKFSALQNDLVQKLNLAPGPHEYILPRDILKKETTQRISPTLTGMETIPAREQKPPVVPGVPGVIPEREPEKGIVPGAVPMAAPEESGKEPTPAIPTQEPPAVTNYIDNLAGSEEAFAKSHAQRLQRGNPETWGYFTPIGQKIEVTPERAEKIKADIDRLYAEGEVIPPAVTIPPAVPVAEPGKTTEVTPAKGITLTLNHPLTKETTASLKEVSQDKDFAALSRHLGVKEVVVDPPYSFDLSQMGGVTKDGRIRLNPNNPNMMETYPHELAHIAFNGMTEGQRNQVRDLVRKNETLLVKEAPGYVGNAEESFAYLLGTKNIESMKMAMAIDPTRIKFEMVTEPKEKPISVGPQRIISWEEMTKKNGGYLTQEDVDKIPEMVKQFGERMLVIKDVNGGRHAMTATDAATALSNPLVDSHTREVFIAVDQEIKPHLDKYTLASLPQMARGFKEALPTLSPIPARPAISEVHPALKPKEPSSVSSKIILRKMQELKPRSVTGESFIYIPELRKALQKEFPTKESFDKAVMDLIEKEILMPAKHSLPAELEKQGIAKDMLEVPYKEKLPGGKELTNYWNGLTVWTAKVGEVSNILKPHPETMGALRQTPEKNIYFSGTPEDRVLLQNEFLRIGQMGYVAARDFFNALPDAELNELAEANRQPILKDRQKLIDNMVHYSTRAATNMVHWGMRAPRPEESFLITRPAPDASIADHRRFINAYGLSTLLRLSGIKQSSKIADIMETTFGFGQGTEDPGYKTVRANLISQGLDERVLGKIEEIYTGITHEHRSAIRSAKNTADLLRVVARFSKNKDAVALAKAMLSSNEVLGYLEAAPVTKYHNTIVREGLEPTTSSFYVGTGHETFLQMDDLLRTTGDYADYLLLHEATHGATGRKMTESDRKKITSWIRSVEKSLSPGDIKSLENYRKDFKLGAASFGLTTHPENVYYGLINEEEFLAQTYSSPEFRSFLKNFMVERKGKKTSLWQEFKDWVRSVLNDMGVTETKLGLQREQFDNLLDRVLSLGGEIMQRDVEARKYAQRPIENPNHPVHADTVAALGNSWQNSNLAHLVDHQLGKTPKGINVITTESHGPQFFHWVRNMESILSQTDFGRKIYEAGRWFKHRTIATYNQWERTYREAVKDLNDDEKVVLLWVLDSNRPIPQANHKVLDAAQKVRTLLDNVWTYMCDNGLDVGYIQNYFPHVFNGAFWIKQKGQDIKMADSLGEALKMAKEALATNGVPVDIEQDALQMPIDGTPLSRKSFWNLNQALVDEIGKRFPVMQGITQDEIANLLINDKIARPLPGKRFFGNMLPRLVNNPNFRRNIDEVIGMYLYGSARKVSQDEFKKTVQTNVEAMPPQDADLRRFVEQTYMPLVLAHPSRFENAIARSLSGFFPGLTGQDIRRISHKFNLIQYVWDMGVSFTSAVANASQFWINAQPIVGPVIAAKAYAKAIHSFKDAQLMRELEEMGITEGVSSFSGVPLAHEVWKDVVNKIRFKEGFSGFAEASLAGFNVVEMVNRFSAYWAGKAWAEKQLKSGKSAEEVAKRIAPANSSLTELGRELDTRMALQSRVQKVRLKTIAMREQFISQWGFELNDKTNFRAGRENLPQILSEAPVRLLSPYKSFILNQLKFTYDTVGIKGWKEHPLTALNFMATSFALGGALANPATAIMVKALSALSLALGGDDLEKELKRKGLWRGLSGLAGFDIAGSVAINAPTLTGPEGVWELVGRFGRSTRDLYKYLLSTETPEIYREKKLVRGIQPAILQRVIDSMEILKTGQYRSPITGTPITLKDPSWDAVKRLFGIMPEKVLTEYDLEAEQQQLKAKFGATSEDMRVRFASAKTPDEQQEVLNKFVKEFNKSLNKFQNVKSEDQVMEGMGEILFWSSWIKNNPAMQKMFMRMTVSREITKLMAMPTYMRPGAAVEMQKRGLLGATPGR